MLYSMIGFRFPVGAAFLALATLGGVEYLHNQTAACTLSHVHAGIETTAHTTRRHSARSHRPTVHGRAQHLPA